MKYCLVVIAFLLASTGVVAREIPFAEGTAARYELNGDRLSRFLDEFLSENGFYCILSERLEQDKRTLNGIRKGTPKEVFNSILYSNQLLSYYDGTAVYIYLASEMVSKFKPLQADQAQSIRTTLTRINLDDANNRTRVDPVSNLIEVIGTPRYVAHIEDLLSAVVQKDTPQVDFLFVPLRYAWASDRSFDTGGKRVRIPGVASVLRQLMLGYGANERSYIGRLDTSYRSRAGGNGRQASVRSSSQTPRSGSSPMGLPVPPPMDRSGIQDVNLEFLDADIGSDLDGLLDIPEVTPLGEDITARIVADPQRNAIIVRDRPEYMAMYKKLINQLDVPVQIIEIEATIIDVYTDKLAEQGVDWRYGSPDHEVMTGEVGMKEDFLNALAGESIDRLTQLPGLQVGAIIGDENRFIARLQLLERDGFVKVASRPKVVTLNDLEAALESSRSVYVPVSGAYDAQLFKVFSGTVLRVTPHVIEDEGEADRIRLIISAEDGDIDESDETNGPSVTRNAVSSQAIIKADTSLLLGGLSRTETVNKSRKVPYLSAIPLLGKLFQSESKTTQNAERLFLISPRILDDNSMEVDVDQELSQRDLYFGERLQ